MIEEFVRKLNNKEYISNYLYQNILNTNKELIPETFDVDKYNDEILTRQYQENKEYFDNIYKGIDDNIKLDEEQSKAILADEKYSLIIAGAGTGKTTTMASKVKYLVEKKNIQPERILVMSYTRKATQELKSRIIDDFNIPAHVTTFHSLGYEYIKEIFKDRKCIILDRNKKQEIFLNYFKELFKDKTKIEEIINNFEVIKNMNSFIFSKYFLNNYKNFTTYDELIDDYVNQKLLEAQKEGYDNHVRSWIERQLLKEENIISIKGDFVKSAGEAIIANFLYKHGFDYLYEEVYDELMDNRSVYKPDFTIEYGGEKIYIEYFGLDDDEYNKIREKKIEYHKEHKNKFIELNKLPLSKIIEILNEKLKELNVEYQDRSSKEIYEHILRLNPLSQVYPFSNFLYDCIKYRKSSPYRDDKELINNYINSLSGLEKENVKVQAKYINDFYIYYSKQLYGGENYYFDFDDLLYYSVKYIEKLTIDTKLRFDYIIIDEYQDISNIKYELTYKTAQRNNARVYAVGDDWQSIYSFSGSRIEYIYNFKQYFKGAKILSITKTYRNSQELINYSGEFVMRNANQIKKNLISEKHIDNPIIKRYFDSEIGPNEEIECLKKTILEIHEKNPLHNILILARTNKMIDRCLEDESLIDGIETKILFKNYEDIKIEGMTMHKSKGLTFDEVILIGLNKSFPSVKTEMTWIEMLYKNKTIEEAVPFAEERRIFYVALTRTKNYVYLLCDINVKKQSEFISELSEIIKA
ncbi:MAG: UvrD-helicase domain-containing protein [Bacilli bacterium]|nr:UvrD-helicase domain-containing protein [Bacilli bacterium]